MACEQFAAAIRAYAVGAPLAAAAAAHLDACPRCQLTVDVERRLSATIDEVLSEVALTAPSAHFVSRLRAHVEVASHRSAWSRVLMPAAAAALCVLAVALIVPRTSRERPESRHVSVIRAVQRPPMAPATSPSADANGTLRVITLPRVRRAHARTVAAKRPGAAPEVLVPEHERAAVGRLFASLQTGRPEIVSMVLKLRGAEMATDAGAATIEPLRIDPVVVSELPGAAAILDMKE